MKHLKTTIFGLSFTLFSLNLSAQQPTIDDSLITTVATSEFISESNSLSVSSNFTNGISHHYSTKSLQTHSLSNPLLPTLKGFFLSNINNGALQEFNLGMQHDDSKKKFFFDNRRNRYSSLWTFASLNYLYADVAGLMDKNLLNQYQNGVVNGLKITPQFLTFAAAFLQVPIANVFLPQIIKNEKTLRWVQIVSGAFMTLVQSATLFIGKPTPYYVLFSALEIGATAYITFDAIKWKPKKKEILID